ncbi:MAG TPA: sigma-54 dependent transcriptional regulator [Desulfuromonadales bacterium]|nr:sigma-54 dependent transcriptional regulator [Desulfuromonadales bacterium]
MSEEHDYLTALPALAPDLVVAEEAGGRWRVLRVSPALSGLAGVPAEAARGRLLSGLFPDQSPALGGLAKEVADGGEGLYGISVRLEAGAPMLIADIMPGGLGEEFRQQVTFTFRPADAAGPKKVHGLIGISPAIREVQRKIALYGPTDATVVITGETGTGKEVVARALHLTGPRRAREFVAVNCTAISDELLESELFGHEKGAFTGALRSHRGRFERADGGTLFLDEIGDMPLTTQAKLLRVLEDGRVERVGAEQARPVDVRVVAATNVPLERAVSQGRFRADLYHRLSVLRIHLPPLRERREDIPLLVEHFLARSNTRYGQKVRRLTSEATALLQSYLWPGNVRELRNVLERVFVETQGDVIGARAFAEWVRERRDFLPGDWNLENAQPPSAVELPYPLAGQQRLLAAPLPPAGRRDTRPAELDPEEIRRAYQAAAGNLTAAARLLGVHRATLYRALERLGLSRADLVEG